MKDAMTTSPREIVQGTSISNSVSHLRIHKRKQHFSPTIFGVCVERSQCLSRVLWCSTYINVGYILPLEEGRQGFVPENKQSSKASSAKGTVTFVKPGTEEKWRIPAQPRALCGVHGRRVANNRCS